MSILDSYNCEVDENNLDKICCFWSNVLEVTPLVLVTFNPSWTVVNTLNTSACFHRNPTHSFIAVFHNEFLVIDGSKLVIFLPKRRP